MFGDHYKSLLGAFFFSAPRTPIKPYQIPDGTELVEVITDGMVYFPGRGGEEFRRGTIFWHQPGEWTISYTSPSEPYRCFVCKFETDGTARQVPRVSKWGGVPDLSRFVDDMLNFTMQRKLDREEIFAYCLGTLLRQQIKESPLPAALKMVCRKLNNDPVTAPSVEELAEYAGISASRLFALFHKHLQSSPHKYLLQCRVNMAKELLAERVGIPIKQVAEMSGFASLEVFYRRFRQHTGITPAEFRRKVTGE
ncbi:MAG: helix-turn-helix domain-containing protein [Lentisphaerae bacterium]|nr:helix-turn-helix domain-containing protein [Lentisphaerota bacterium]